MNATIPVTAPDTVEDTQIATTSQTIRTTCAYCGVGCGVLATVETDQNGTCSVSVAGDPDHPANFGKLCSKGNALGDTLDVNRRLAYPSIQGERVNWDTATSHVADKLSDIIAKHGKDSVMLYVSGQLLTEDYYVANKFTKGFLGTNNIDSNSRLCMSSAVAGYKRAFGSDTVPCSYTDIEESELFVIIGSNMAWCHPILFGRLKASKAANPNKKVVVIDPRATDSTQIADMHLPLRGGTDTHLFNGLLNYLHMHGHGDAAYLAHCDDLDDALAAAKSWSVDKVAQICGLDAADVEAFYKLFAGTKKTVTFFSMGVNQSTTGTDKVNGIINAHLYTGKVGYAGAGVFSITGQPNAMGGREVGALANLLAGHFNLYDAKHREAVAEFWGTPQSIVTHDGIKAPEVADSILEGKIKAVWIMATNPVVSLTEADRYAAALKMCDLVIVSDCSKDSDTLDFAHVKLPAMGWSERCGTVTNSERRVSRQRQLIEPFAEAKSDWWMISQVAKKMGFSGFDYTHASEIFSEYARLTGFKNGEAGYERSLDISHLLDESGQISVEDYDALEPFQWGSAHFFGDEQIQSGEIYTDSGRAHFVPITPNIPRSMPSENFPYVLNTGRLRDQWHTMTRTGLAHQLNQHLPQPFVAMHPIDAKKLGIGADDFVEVSSLHGKLLTRASLSEGQREGDVFMPMHWNNHFTANARVGKLINNHVDDVSHQPEFKFTPVALERVSMGGFAKLMINQDADDALLAWFDEAEAGRGIDYWVRSRQAQSSDFLLATSQNSTGFQTWFDAYFWQESLQHILLECGVLTEQDVENGLSRLSYQDANADNQSLRVALIKDDKPLAVLFASTLEDKLPNHIWLDTLFNSPLDKLNRKWLLAGRAAAGFVDVGRIVCSCMTVGENTIIDTIKEHGCTSAAEVGAHCKAGTNCGSCLGEVNAILKGVQVEMAG